MHYTRAEVIAEYIANAESERAQSIQHIQQLIETLEGKHDVTIEAGAELIITEYLNRKALGAIERLNWLRSLEGKQ